MLLRAYETGVIGRQRSADHDDGMETRILVASGDGTAAPASRIPEGDRETGWVWIDILVGDTDIDELLELTTGLRFDAMAMRDAVEDLDVPKVDDFGHHLLIILHGLRDDTIQTYELDCFLAAHHLVTVRRRPAPALEALWERTQVSPELALGGVDELAARLADVLTRRLLAVIDTFDENVDGLVDKALSADPHLLAELTAVRSDLAAIRRVVHPQREVLDLLRRSTSPLIGAAGRRRFSDVFDVASRATLGLDAARSALADILDAYRGAEAREATDVTKVLTIYAAIMLPLTLVVGFFGMNFSNLPGIDGDSGWIVVTAIMLLVAMMSLGVFVAVGWIKRPSGRRAGAALGRGLIEATRAPAQVAGAVFEITTMPLRATTARRTKAPSADDT